MKGIYVLLIDVKNAIHINVGRLGEVAFTSGLYAYIGSAQNNIEKRVERHLRKRKRCFWHIDYLLSQDDSTVLEVLYKAGAKEEECRVAKSLAAKNESFRSFGCSDCRCESHLFKLSENTVNLANLGFAPFMNLSEE
jgi:Uri superfamily endonuclease